MKQEVSIERRWWLRAWALLAIATALVVANLVPSLSASAVTDTYALNAPRARNQLIYSGYFVEVTGGAARADLSNDGWYGTMIGRTQTTTTIFITCTGGPGTWVTWSSLHAPNARNIGYWTTSFNTGTVTYPTSGKVDH